MKRNIVIGLLVGILVCVAGFGAFYYFTEINPAEIEKEVFSLPETTTPETKTLVNELQESKVVYNMTMEIRVILRGELVKVSVSDRIIVVQDNGDSLTIYLRKDAIMPILGQDPQRIEMTKIKSYLGERVTVLAILIGEKLEGNTFLLGNVNIKLR